MARSPLALAVALALLLATCAPAGAVAPADTLAAPPLERVADVPLPGAPSRFDYQSIDTTANRLYLSHMGAGELLAVDLATRSVVGRIPNLPRVTAVWAVPRLGKVYASVPGDHQVAILSIDSLRVMARVGPIGFPDGIADVPGLDRLYVSDERAGEELVIDGATNRVITSISLGGEAGNSIYDPGSGRVLVALQSRNQLVEIDPRANRVVARHALPGSAGPHGLALDSAGRRLFVASEDGARVQLVDLRSMSVLDQQPVGDEPDVVAFDPGLGRLYVGSESGAVSVFSVGSHGLTDAGRLSMPHAHSVAVDPRTHLVYLPLENVDGHPVLRILAPAAMR